MKQIQKMSDAEMEVMKVLWNCGGAATSPALHELLSSTKEWKQNTVITFLARLTDKGLIRAEKQGRGKASLYVALITEEEYKRCETADFLNQVHDGSMTSLMAALSGGRQLTRGQLQELKDWFARLEEGK